MMGMTGMFKWLRKDIIQRDRSRQSLPPKLTGFNNDAYRTALQAFLARRKNPTDPGYIMSPNSTDTSGFDFFIKNNCENEKSRDKVENCDIPICGVPHVQLAEMFEIGWVAGTEDRYIELIYAEWQNTKVALRRHINRECVGAVKTDIKVLSEVRHTNVLLLMGTTQTVDNNLVAIFEPVDCTLYHFIHEQSERIPIQGIAKCTGSLAAALKYAHMRGYIHTAISSHCVFLTSSGIAKLGGWELAIDTTKPLMEIRKYEDRLRSEIFRWQAPELFSGHKPTIATDVYGLTLLMWEICTTNIPWADLSKEEVETQYLQCKQRITIDTYNFPALLNNLLETGLQLDVSKRSLDMSMMTRFLQRLEMQYEDKEPIYVDRRSINRTDSQNNTRLSCISEPSFSQDSLSVQLPSISSDSPGENIKGSPVQRNPYEKKQIEPRKLFPKTRLLNRSLDSTNIRNIDLTSKGSKINEKKSPELKRKPSTPGKMTKMIENQVKDSSTQEVISNPRIDIKKLKEILANRRRNFFCGNSSPHNPLQDKDKFVKSSILKEIKSKDYEPHKPASHKTGIEPKLSPSPGQYSTFIKPAQRKIPKSPYSYVPVPIRSAVIQPQVLNSDSQSFFESSLWSKEKSMCLSKSRNDDSELLENKSSVSPDSDKTFTINSPIDHIRGASENFTPITDLTTDVTISTIPRSKSLQALKDTLDRVTSLVKLNSSNATDMTPFPTPTIKDFENFNNANDDVMKTSESLFEELYDLNENIDDRIKTIERSSSQRYFTVDLKKTHEGSEELFTKKTNFAHIPNYSIQNKQSPTLVELKTALECGLPISRNTKEYNLIKRKIETKTSMIDTRTETPIRFMIDTEDDRNFEFLGVNNKIKGNKYMSYSEVILARRRSLPSSLGEFKSATDMSFAKLCNKDAVIPDSTVEDFYIDDEFDENGLAPNMILLDKNSTAGSHDIFPDLTEKYENV